MSRLICSPEEIRTLVHKRVHSVREIREDSASIRVPKPERIPPDSDGCNWTMRVFGDAGPHVEIVQSVVRTLRTEVNLPEE